MSNFDCKETGCKSYPIKEGYCAKHFIYNNREESKYKEIMKKYPWQGLYYTNRWKKLRNMHLSSQPLCVKCNALGSDVDHIIDHKGNLDLFYDADNLQTLCKPCHAKKTFSDADFFKLKKSKEWSTTINLVDESECQMLNMMKAMGVSKDTDYLYKLLLNSNDNIFKLSKKAYIIKLYKLLAIKLNEKPKLTTNSADILNILSEE